MVGLFIRFGIMTYEGTFINAKVLVQCMREVLVG
jgi:hypothetical protein